MGSTPAPAGVTAVQQLWTQRASQVLSGAAASVTFSGLTDSAYRLTCNYSLTAAVNPRLTLNNDTGANYSEQQAYANAGSITAVRNTGQAFIPLVVTGVSNQDLAHGVTIVVQKPIAGQHGHVLITTAANRAAGTNQISEMVAAIWGNTADKATRIDLVLSSSTYKSGSTFTVEGIV